MKLTQAFKELTYSNYEYYGLFFQTDRVDQNLRNILHKYLSSRFQEAGPSVAGQKLVTTIFNGGAAITGKKDLAMNIGQFMADK